MRKFVHARFAFVLAATAALTLTGSLSAQGTAPPARTETFPTSSASKGPTTPRQAWARADGLEELKPLRQPVTADQVADRLAIEDAFGRWGIAFDEGREEVVRSLFTTDGYMQGQIGKYDPKAPRTTGSAAIGRFATDGWKGQGDQRRHVIGNIVLTSLTRDRASALAYGVVTVAASGLYLGSTVIYSADLKKESDGIWRFSRFIVGMDDYVTRP